MGILRIYKYQVSRFALATVIAASLGGCVTQRPDITGSVSNSPRPASESDWRKQIDQLANQYREQPNDPRIAVAYAHALRQIGQRSQAAAVLQQAALRSPKNSEVLGAYGRALADTGQYGQALEVLSKAHTPDQPDWRVLNAQGAVYDQIGNHAEARRFYETALKISPNEPAILSNLGLSYALSKDLVRAETILRRADGPSVDPKIRQNLGLVLALQGKTEESQRVTAGLLTPEQVQQNVAYFRDMQREKEPKVVEKKKPTKQAQPSADPKKVASQPLDLSKVAVPN